MNIIMQILQNKIYEFCEFSSWICQGEFMSDKKIKTKDMIIAIICTLLAVLSIVFYFLPAFNVKHKANPSLDYEVVNFSGWDMTKSVFSDTVIIGTKVEKLLAIKRSYGFAIIMSGLLMPLGIMCTIATTVFTYLSWLKNEEHKKYCFMFSLVGMVFATFTLISTWYVAIQIRNGNNFQVFGANLKGGISYASFVTLILAFVVAIVACAYNYFLDNFDDEDEEDDEEDDDDDEYEEVVVVRRKKKTGEIEEKEEVRPKAKTPKLETAREKDEDDKNKFIKREKTTKK